MVIHIPFAYNVKIFNKAALNDLPHKSLQPKPVCVCVRVQDGFAAEHERDRASEPGHEAEDQLGQLTTALGYRFLVCHKCCV